MLRSAQVGACERGACRAGTCIGVARKLYCVQAVKNLLCVCRRHDACTKQLWRTLRAISHYELTHGAQLALIKRATALKVLAAFAANTAWTDEQLADGLGALGAYLQRAVSIDANVDETCTFCTVLPGDDAVDRSNDETNRPLIGAHRTACTVPQSELDVVK